MLEGKYRVTWGRGAAGGDLNRDASLQSLWVPAVQCSSQRALQCGSPSVLGYKITASPGPARSTRAGRVWKSYGDLGLVTPKVSDSNAVLVLGRPRSAESAALPRWSHCMTRLGKKCLITSRLHAHIHARSLRTCSLHTCMCLLAAQLPALPSHASKCWPALGSGPGAQIVNSLLPLFIHSRATR